MPFVFEARRMCFDDISEARAAGLERIAPGLSQRRLESTTQLSLWERCMLATVLPIVRAAHDAQGTQSHDADQETSDVRVALRIVDQLDELEEVVARMQSAHNSEADDEEEQSMAALLRERLGTDEVHQEDSNGSGRDAPDMAMCFDSVGESIGIGSAAMFGGHGYHAD